jgi:hypothetical protein
MPLTRMPSGDLGVKAAGGSQIVYSPTVNVTVEGAGGSEEEKRRTGEIVGKEVERVLDRKIDARIQRNMRPGAQLNPVNEPI